VTDQGRTRTAGDTSIEAPPEDLQEQRIPAVAGDGLAGGPDADEPEDIALGYGIPAEADEADAADQLRSAPFDDDDRR
jgi:hypothetical protein